MDTFLAIALGVLIVALLTVVLYLAYFRSKSFKLASGPEERKEKQKEAKDLKPAKEPEKHSYGHGSEQSTPFVKALKALVIILLALLVVWYAIPLLGGVVDTFNHVVFGDRIVRPSTVIPGPRTDVGTTEEPSRIQIESQNYKVAITDGIMPDWIRIPDGYRMMYRTEGLPDGKTDIGRQCSSAIEGPPYTANDESYWCKPESDIMGRWFRPYIYEHGEKMLVFYYHFRHV